MADEMAEEISLEMEDATLAGAEVTDPAADVTFATAEEAADDTAELVAATELDATLLGAGARAATACWS